MTPLEFVSGGLLADLCRHWAHPIGLDVMIASAQGSRVSLEVIDEFLTTPGGAAGLAADHPNAAAKLRRVQAMRVRRRAYRIRTLGAYYEPVAGHTDDVISLARPLQVEGSPALAEAIGALVGRLAADALHALTAALPDCPEPLQAWIAEAITAKASVAVAHVLARLRVTYEGGFLLSDAPDDTSGSDKAAGIRARTEFLAAEIPGLQADYGSLYAPEVDEANTIIERLAFVMANQHDDQILESDEVAKALKRLEDLHGLAQPGMRFFRPEAEEYHVGIESLRLWAKKTILEFRQTRTDIDNLMAGDVAPEDVENKEAVAAFLREQISLRESTLAQIQEAGAEESAAIKRLASAVEAIEASSSQGDP